MKLKKMLAGQLLALALAFPQAVSAEDFTLRVPVKFSNIHEDVNKVMVVCRVRNNAANIIIGSGETIVDSPNNGNLMQTITVKFDAGLGKNRADAQSYTCYLNVQQEISNYFTFLPSTHSACTSTNNDWFCAKEGALFHSTSTGPIP